ncbi:hypothetical protein A1O3_08591 [Capronia epimyces CBS 606.96]|uniref:Uncharacterized protein n=1 Tax=Capronia epimyces CBS 606.96 TaxID=1182542 RepID=W9XP37_9EURO|nr:uncharacterized protein A1O3_08591 [Capronia epimyces CBS 606.96]EXJ79090.1 hypothetical protein A1O3_08591 [Capronia epimyces CBS 606.96]
MLTNTPRAAIRSTRVLRVRQPIRPRQPRSLRFQSTSAPKDTSSASSPALIGGIAGGAVALLGGYLWYQLSGAKTVLNNVHAAKSYVDNAFQKTTQSAPAPNEAIQWLRETVNSYTKMIPGASKYVDSAFDDLDKVREKHGKEVDKIINETHGELKDVTKAGFSVEAVSRAWDVLQKCFGRIASLASDAADDILDNHPELKDKVGGNLQQLKQMGEHYGPEAKQKVDETWQQVRDILKGGVSVETATKLQSLVQEKTQELKQYGDQAWQKGIEQAKPLLDKQPQLKELLESNKEKLLQGDLGQLWQKVQEASKSGKTDDLQSFVKEQANKVSGGSASGGIEQFLHMIPGGKELGPKLQQLQELSQKHGQEAEKLVKSAIEDVQKVLSQKVEEGQKLKEKAKADAKKQ